MKSSTIFYMFFNLICLSHFVICSSKIGQCKFVTPQRAYIDIELICCDECEAIDFSSTETFVCNTKDSDKKSNLNYDKITVMHISNCKSNSLKNLINFGKFPRLAYLFISNIGFHQIDESFNNNHKLQHVTATVNNIDSIDTSAFQNVEVLIFNENKISSINETTFAGLSHLELLDISKNKIYSIHPNAFTDLENLKWLRLSFNSIAQIEPGTFSKLKNLIELNLSNNALKKIDFELIAQMCETLKYLYIDRNELNKLEIPNDLYFQNLEKLTIAENKFDCHKLQNYNSAGVDCMGVLQLYSNENTKSKIAILFLLIGIFIGASSAIIILAICKLLKMFKTNEENSNRESNIYESIVYTNTINPNYDHLNFNQLNKIERLAAKKKNENYK